MPNAPRRSSGLPDAPPRDDRPTTTDFVTSLEPRGRLEERLATLLPAREPLAMVIVDVVGLKAVNERDGFLAGDAMLRAAADRLRAAAAEAAMVARLGGDELVAVFLGPGAADSARETLASLAIETTQPALRAAGLTADPGENAAGLIERLYATLRRC